MKTVRRTRRTRRTVRTAGLVAVAAAAAFSLTACEGDGGKDDAGSASSAGSSKESASQDSGSKDSKDSKGSDAKDSGSKDSKDSNGSGSTDNGGAQEDNGGNGDKGSNGSTGSNGANGSQGNKGGTDVQAKTSADVKRSTCTVGKVTVRLQQTGGSAPVILLKATNRDDTRCDLYGYPFVGYTDAQSPVAVGGGPPQSVVSLEPGQSAYASLSLEEGDGNNMHREKRLTVELADRNLHGTGKTADLTAPGVGLALSDSSTVSYWKSTTEQAMQ